MIVHTSRPPVTSPLAHRLHQAVQANPPRKRRGGRRFTDGCPACGHQVARGKACDRCSPAQIAGAVAAKKLAARAASSVEGGAA